MRIWERVIVNSRVASPAVTGRGRERALETLDCHMGNPILSNSSRV